MKISLKILISIDAKDICKLVWWIDRFLEQNKVEAETAKRYRFRKRMLFQTSRIWTFRVFINRRVLIDCRFWTEQNVDASTTDKELRRRRTDLIVQQTRIDSFFSTFHVIALVSCVIDSSLDVDCKNVKNRRKQRMRFWCHWSKLTSRCSELIECRWSRQIAETETKRSETWISRSCWECNRSRNRKFWCWVWMIVCWFDDLMCVWLLFFSLSSDVSTLQKDDYCRNHLMNGLTDSRKHENRLLIVILANSRADWLSKQENRLLNRFVDMEMLYVNFSFNSRRRHASWSFSKKTFWRFSFKHSRIFTSDESFVSTRFLYEQMAIFFNYSRISTSISDDFI